MHLCILECRYFLALHLPGSTKLTLQPTPVYLVSCQAKAFMDFSPTEPGTSERPQARNMLGKVHLKHSLAWGHAVLTFCWRTLLFWRRWQPPQRLPEGVRRVSQLSPTH